MYGGLTLLVGGAVRSVWGHRREPRLRPLDLYQLRGLIPDLSCDKRLP